MSRALIFPGRARPVAVVVQADARRVDTGQAGTPALDNISEEGSRIAEMLHKAEYDVFLLTSGRYSELRDLLADIDICDRLVVFHYCGHANREFIQLTDDSGTAMDVSAESLRDQMAGATNALRLVYINGCMSDGQENEFRDMFPRVNFIGTKIKIPDWFAKSFALSFYGQLVGKASPFGTLSFAAAMRRAAGQDKGKKPDRIKRVMHVQFDGDGLSHDPDMGFALTDGQGLIARYLLDKRETRRSSVLMAYCVFVLMWTGVFAYLAHILPRTSSPAFQAAFSYRPDARTFELIDGLRASGAGLSCDAAVYHMGKLSPLFGFIVEWVRIFGLMVCLFVIASMIYRRMPRDYPDLFSARWRDWFALTHNKGFAIFTVTGFFAITAYHLLAAPGALERVAGSTDITWLQLRWPVYGCHGDLWRGFSTRFGLESGAAGDPALGAPLFRTPYLYYLGYSLGNYLLAAVPIVVIIIKGLIHGARNVRLELEALRVRARETRDARDSDDFMLIQGLKRAQRTMSGHFLRFTATLFLLTCFATFEILVGRTTTALFAQIIAVLVFIMSALGAAQILSVWNSYRDALEKIDRIIAGIRDEATLRRFATTSDMIQTMGFPASAASIGLFVISMLMLVWLVLILTPLYGPDWTLFTHGLFPGQPG